MGVMQRFPSLVRRIVERYQAHRYQTSLVNRYRAQTAALQFFIDDRYAALIPER